MLTACGFVVKIRLQKYYPAINYFLIFMNKAKAGSVLGKFFLVRAGFSARSGRRPEASWEF